VGENNLVVNLNVNGNGRQDAHQSAEQLFEQRPVEEIRGVEERAQKQVQLKQEELRQIIGASYREFIDSADGIKAMSESSIRAAKDLEEIKSKILELGKQLEKKLEEGTSTGKSLNEDSSVPLGLFDLGSRAKLLLDTPESIWAVLEAEKSNRGSLSHGARLAARAFVLWHSQGKEVSKKFPLLSKQKAQLVDLCRRLRTACLNRLEKARLERPLIIDALAALVLLDVVKGKDSSQAQQDQDLCKSGLSLCSIWLKQRLSAIPKAAGSWESLFEVGQIVKDVICEVESLFVASKQYAKVNLATLCLPDVEGDIWYKALPRHESELRLWKQHLDDFVQTTSPISLKMVSELCSKWIKSVQKESEKIGIEQIGVLSALPELMEAEKKVHSMLDGNDSDEYSGDSREFENHCLAILHRQVHLWKEFYEVSFVSKARGIIEESFSQILPMVKNEVQKIDPSAEVGLEYRNKLCRILDRIRVSVGKIFTETVEFILLPCDSSVLESRTSVLQSFLQECCFNLLTQIGEHLNQLMIDDSSSSGSSGAQPEYGVFLSNFCDCLQTENSELFSFIFGKPKEWLNIVLSNKKDISAIETYSLDISGIHKARSDIIGQLRESSLSTAQATLSSLEFPHKDEVNQKLQSISVGAYRSFVDHVCSSIQESVQDKLEKDYNLRSSKNDTNWEEVVVQHQDEEGNSIDMKFHLPHSPSSFVVHELFSALMELHKARYVKSNLPNLRAFEEALSLSFMKGFSHFLDGHGQSLSERGALQLLFDVRFLFDILAGGSQSSYSGASRVQTQHSRHSMQLEQRLSGLLDPIDWATYEPYLWKNEVQFYHRCGLLFHDFMAIHKVHSEKEVKMKSSTQSNIMEMSSNVPRFNYLPISTPSVFKAETADDMFNLLSGTFGEPQVKQTSQSSNSNSNNNDENGMAEKSNLFGSILGEKAAEATAMAQDLFSGGGFFTSLTGKPK
jgi:hypothetical protein